jgi:uncharacterized phage infection (PIP) family protein YhgE
MKTEFLKGLGLEDEVIAKIMAENGKDIEKEKAKVTELNGKLETANKKVSEYETTIEDLKKSAEGNEDFKKKFEELEQKIADEKAEAERKEQEAKEEASLSERFKTVVGENKWRDELTEKAVYSEFKNSLKDEANKGKGDKDILEALTKDKGYFSDPSKTPGIFSKGTGGGTGGEQNPFNFAFTGIRTIEKK